jgi:hypothetical protein
VCADVPTAIAISPLPLIDGINASDSGSALPTSRFPTYISHAALVVTGVVALSLLAWSVYFFVLSAWNHEPLNGGSHWLAAISFAGATKSAAQVIYRQARMRQLWITYHTQM